MRDKVHSLLVPGKTLHADIILLSQLHWLSRVTGQTADRGIDWLAIPVCCSASRIEEVEPTAPQSGAA